MWAKNIVFGLAVLALSAQTPETNSKSSKTVAGNAEAGKRLFEVKCAVCHSVESNQRQVGPGLKDTHKGKLPSGKPATHDVILKLINEGGDNTVSSGSGMPVFKDLLSAQEKEDLIAYVRSL
jgi:mono/diheme cytochrome c family protein